MSEKKKPPAFKPGGGHKSVRVRQEVYDAVEAVRVEQERRLGCSLPVGDFFASMALKGAETFKKEEKR